MGRSTRGTITRKLWSDRSSRECAPPLNIPHKETPIRLHRIPIRALEARACPKSCSDLRVEHYAGGLISASPGVKRGSRNGQARQYLEGICAGSEVAGADAVGFVVSRHSLLWFVLLDVGEKLEGEKEG